RLKLMQIVTTSAGWRTSEPMNRAIAVVTARIPSALLETERSYIAASLAYPAVFSTACGDQKNIPEQYRLPTVAAVISIFQEEIDQMLRDIKMHKNYKHHKQIVHLFRSLFGTISSENLRASEAAETSKV
uniref:Proteasome activator complex subunit 4 C-terminal domain-containing protein n=1 Tax=Parascaris univalens TaxID=6257 RepID=A0A915A1Q1_PARUN